MGYLLFIWIAVVLVGVPVALIAGLIYLRRRLNEMQFQIDLLTRHVTGTEVPEPIPETPILETAGVEPPTPEPRPSAAAAAPALYEPPRRSTEEWETLLGGNWLNKLGVFVLVVGIALGLGYSFTRVGPFGRVSLSVAVSLSMLAGGAYLEGRDRYRTFGRGLIGGGWAALYITVYAMHAVAAARVIPNPIAGFLLLLAVAAGMIVHSLRYRSEAVTGLGYFAAFGTLAITEVNGVRELAMIPLAITLLYMAHRFAWERMALLGVISTYAVWALRATDTGTLWQTQTILAIYWLLFELYDIVHPNAWLLPLNATGFLGLSVLKWHAAAPQYVWAFLAVTALAYLASAALRWRERYWQPAATLAAALAAAAVFQKLDHQWVATALVVEAELAYLAGIRLGVPYLRWLGTALFGVEIGRFLIHDVADLPSVAWLPVASLDAAVFYLNRILYPADWFYGFAGAAMLALVAGKEAPAPFRGVAWLCLAAAAFAWGWWRRLFDLRIQGYLLGILGITAVLAEQYSAPLALAAALSYSLALCALRTSGGLFAEEAAPVRVSASVATTILLSTLAWRMVPGAFLALAWIAVALLLLEAGIRGFPSDFRLQAYAVAALAFVRCWWFNFRETKLPLGNTASTVISLLVISGFYAAQLRLARGSRGRLFYSLLGAILMSVLLYYKISGSLLTVAWGLEGLVLLATGFPLRDRVLRISGLSLLLWCILKLFVWDLRHLETLPRILSFIVLGLILVAVSWVYTRFRDRAAKLL